MGLLNQLYHFCFRSIELISKKCINHPHEANIKIYNIILMCNNNNIPIEIVVVRCRCSAAVCCCTDAHELIDYVANIHMYIYIELSYK